MSLGPSAQGARKKGHDLFLLMDDEGVARDFAWSRSAERESALVHGTESWCGREGEGFVPVQEQGMLDRPAGI